MHVPAGLDLGPTTHQEIAVAILAELVGLRAAGRLGTSVSGMAEDSGGAKTAVETAVDEAHAVDPVCGMTVTAGPSAYPLSRDGVTCYFCCAGCRSAFEKDPVAYLGDETRC